MRRRITNNAGGLFLPLAYKKRPVVVEQRRR